MSYYNDIALDKAIKEAEREYDWDISYEMIESQEIGGGSVIELYEVDIDGQYAEQDAEDFFLDFNFYSVAVLQTDIGFSRLHIEIRA
jgi:hypothetical protein